MYGESHSNRERFAAAILSIAATGSFGVGLLIGLGFDYGERSDVAASQTHLFSLNEARQAVDKPKRTRSPARQNSNNIVMRAAVQVTLPKPLPIPSSNVIYEPAENPDQAVASQASGSGSDNEAETQSGQSHEGSAAKAPPSTGGDGASADKSADDRYAAQVYQRVASRIELTAALRSKHIYGTARIRIVIDANGRLLEASLVGSSGNFELDRVALSQAHSAAPFPKRPKTSHWTQRSFVIPMTYRQRRR